jgi:transposase
VLWLARSGRSLVEVSKILAVPYRTVRRWLDWYRHEGLQAVLTRLPGQEGGSESYLTPEQEEQLRDQADTGAFRTAREAQRWIQEQWDVHYTRKGIYSLFERLEIVWKVPRPQSNKADPQQQESWKKGGSRTT